MISAGDGVVGVGRDAVCGRGAVAGRGAAPRHGGCGRWTTAGPRARTTGPVREGTQRTYITHGVWRFPDSLSLEDIG